MTEQKRLVPLTSYPFKERPMVVAHRGDPRTEDEENSLVAIERAIEDGVDMVEVDVQQTSDGVFLCHHDEHLGDERLEDMSLEMVVERSGELDISPPPTLLAVLELVRGRIYLNLEVKEYTRKEPRPLMQSLEAILRSEVMESFCLISSFRADLIRAAGWLLPTVIIKTPDEMLQKAQSTLASLDRAIPEGSLPSEILQESGATGYACTMDELTPEAVDDLRRHNIGFSVYPIRTEDEFRRAFELGAGGILCDDPARFVALRNELQRS